MAGSRLPQALMWLAVRCPAIFTWVKHLLLSVDLCSSGLLLDRCLETAYRDPKQRCLLRFLSPAAHPIPSISAYCYLFSKCSTAIVHRYWDNWHWFKLPNCKMKLCVPGAGSETAKASRQLWGRNLCCPSCSSWTMQQDGNIQESNGADNWGRDWFVISVSPFQNRASNTSRNFRGGKPCIKTRYHYRTSHISSI